MRNKGKNMRRFLKKFDGLPDLRRSSTFNYAMLALAGICVGLVSLLLGATVFGLNMFWTYFSSPMVILLNLLPPILLIFLVYFISGRAWIAFTFPSLLILTVSVTHFFKVQLRGDPFILSDILLVREVNKVIAPYTLVMNWKIYFAIFAFVCGVAFSVFILKYKPKKAKLRAISSLVIIALSAALYTTVYTNTKIYADTKGSFSVHEWSTTHTYIAKGFVYPFIHSIKDTLTDISGATPDWYDAQEAALMLGSFGEPTIPADKKVNIIAITLEAYCDLSLLSALDFESEVYEPLHALEEESFSGTLTTNTYGGGTTDAERLFLTGNTRFTNFSSPTNSYVHYLRSQGYHTEGFHAGDMWFYDRRPINAYLGFDNYYFLEDFDDSNRYDWFFFPTVASLYKERDAKNPYFSYNLSYQNHGPYDSSKTHEPYLIAKNGLSDESFNILNNYLIGIRDTTSRLASFIDTLRADSDPVVVVVFGDHMPWLGNLSSVYLELGINIDRNTQDGYLNYYSTPYFIWANNPAKTMLGNDFNGNGGSFSPCFLMGELFRLCSWEGEGYMQALRELQTRVDIINAPFGTFREYGVMTGTLSPDSQEAYQRLLGMEIYRRKNFFYTDTYSPISR